MIDMKRLDGDNQVALEFAAVLGLLAEAKAELRADSCTGAMEKVAIAENLLNRALANLEGVTSVPWTALAFQGQRA